MKKLEGLAYSITNVKEDVEAGPELEQRLQQAKKDIVYNNVYSTDEILEMIDQGIKN
ncbi:hypothetical protein [Ornithinibacillus contaminans]|uniref:hypothetical protein n=1 Tax=Ornithinibacillus contaminans TaxID=694055 RepID=UPI0012EE44AF|nr:hypothetical protein [Ornithinibacillus contaminans]